MASIKNPLRKREMYFAAENERTFAELVRDAIPGVDAGVAAGIRANQQYGPDMLAAVRAAAPERTKFYTQQFEAAMRGEAPAGFQRAFTEQFRSADVARLGVLGARQPLRTLEESLNYGQLVHGFGVEAVEGLPTYDPTFLMNKYIPDIGMGVSAEQQRGANIQAKLNARRQASFALSERKMKMGAGMATTGAGAVMMAIPGGQVPGMMLMGSGIGMMSGGQSGAPMAMPSMLNFTGSAQQRQPAPQQQQWSGQGSAFGRMFDGGQ